MVDFDKNDPRYLVELYLMKELMYRLLDTLTEREKKIIILYDIEGLTLRKIGNLFNVHYERIRQIKCKAYRKLNHPSRLYPIKSCLTHTPIHDFTKKDYKCIFQL